MTEYKLVRTKHKNGLSCAQLISYAFFVRFALGYRWWWWCWYVMDSVACACCVYFFSRYCGLFYTRIFAICVLLTCAELLGKSALTIQLIQNHFVGM
jgi:hypothetical protein